MELGAAPYDAGQFSQQKLSAAKTFMAPQSYFNDQDAVLFRKFAVRLIEQQSKCEKFDALVPYLAMIYFDRVVSKCDIKPVLPNRGENMKLFVVSCLTIASKMRTHSFKLSQFLEKNNLQYEVNAVMKMELYICRALEWCLRPVTPLCYAEYFIYLLQPHVGGRFPRRPVRQTIINSQANMDFLVYKPSIIGASAVLVVSSKLFPQQFEAFKNHLSNIDYMRRNTGEMSECMEAIQPLYKPPSGPKPQSGAKPDEPSSSRSSKPKPGEISPRLLAASAAPGVDLNEVIRSIGSEPVGTVGEITPEIGPSPKPEATESELDELMNFELEWADANGDDEEGLTNFVGARMGHPGWGLVQKLANCCPELWEKMSSSCTIL